MIHHQDEEKRNKNERVFLDITGITSEGNGVGHDRGMAVFVPNTAQGDQIEAKLVKLYKKYAYGRLENILVPSSDRIEPDCPVSSRCGGCSLRHIGYEAEKRVKRQQVIDGFSRIGGFTDEKLFQPLLSTGIVDGYRNKAMLPVRRSGGSVQIGFYASRSHNVVESAACRLHPAEFTLICDAVRQYIEAAGVTCYDENDSSGLIRHLYLRKAFATGQIMVCLVINGHGLTNSEALLSRLAALHLPIVSVAVNQNSVKTNVILGEHTKLLSGSLTIEDVLCGVKVRLQPRSFYQVNHDAAEMLYRKAAEYAALTGEETLIDLYCGTGVIGLSMADRVKRLIGVEVVDKAVEDARQNAQTNGVLNAEFLCADAAQAAQRFACEGVRPDVVVLDPPRKGCDASVLHAIAQMNPARIIMISCNPATAARDCMLLCAGSYELREITPVDLFPRTNHVECVALLCHKQKMR